MNIHGRKNWDKLYQKKKGNCFICRRLTHIISISYMGYYCFSVKCENKLFKDLELCNSGLCPHVK